MTSPRLRIDDITIVDEIRMHRLAPLLDTVDRAMKAIAEAEVPQLGAFEDAEKSVYEHQRVVDKVGAEIPDLMRALMSAVSNNEAVMAVFQEQVERGEVDIARLTAMLDQHDVEIGSAASSATGPGSGEAGA